MCVCVYSTDSILLIRKPLSSGPASKALVADEPKEEGDSDVISEHLEDESSDSSVPHPPLSHDYSGSYNGDTSTPEATSTPLMFSKTTGNVCVLLYDNIICSRY